MKKLLEMQALAALIALWYIEEPTKELCVDSG